MKRVALTGLAASLLLTGCAGGDATSSYGQYYEVLKQSFAGTFGNKAVTRDRAAAVPYASLGYRLNGGPESLIVLATDSSGEQLWTSNAHIVVVTLEGRVKHTVGLPHDVGQLAPAAGASLPAPAGALKAPETSTLSVDFPDIGVYSATVSCRLTSTGPETISILGHDIATTRVDENCDSPQLKWRYRNSYWLDADNFVWRSIQHIHPSGDTLDIEIFRPPG